VITMTIEQYIATGEIKLDGQTISDQLKIIAKEYLDLSSKQTEYERLSLAKYEELQTKFNQEQGIITRQS